MAARRLLIVGNSVSMPLQAGADAYPTRLAALVGDRWQIETIIRSGATIEEMEADVVSALLRAHWTAFPALQLVEAIRPAHPASLPRQRQTPEPATNLRSTRICSR